MRILRILPIACVLAVVSATHPAARQQQTKPPSFRVRTDLVSVDVVVRDRSGAIVSGLKPEDFEIREDGKAQQIVTFSFQQVTGKVAAPVETADLLASAESRLERENQHTPTAAQPSAEAAPVPMTPEQLAGRRVIVLLFDTSSMQPDDVQRAVDAANKYVGTSMTAADLVAVATIGSSLQVLTDFTASREQVAAALTKLGYTEGTSTPPPSASTLATDEADAAADDTTESADAAELDMFNNDLRLRALRALAETLAPIEQRKAILYFSAGMERSGEDNQVELRAAINAAVRANVSIYPVDSRGLQAVVPGGDATHASGRGSSLFSGRAVAQQFNSLAASQETLTSLASDTGGRAFTDTNDMGEAFARVTKDLSAYYLLGYSSTNPVRDGRFRRIQVRVKRNGMHVESRAGYYAERDFAHTSRADRETDLQNMLFAALSPTDLPVLLTPGYFRLTNDSYYVPIAVAIPGSAVPIPPNADKVTLDIVGVVRDEQGRPVGHIRQTLDLAAGSASTLAGKQVLYQSGLTLPPGRFAAKVVVRENESGLAGSYESAIVIPDLKREPVKVSSILLSTQIQTAAKGKSDNPLVRDGVQLLPNVTHVVGHDQNVYFYYEVYDPAASGGANPDLRTSLAFYRGKVKVFETPPVERTTLDLAARHAAIFQFEVPADRFKPGLYTCQINIIDSVAGQFAFPRLAMFVR
ncbi:MAG TPA: VWA domain-containing protein [Vicinamibacterales bacterium]|jgi:VWFA-related protein|nr:VWA domain-containing protein [Vicinamibacterales bacterium]